MAVKILDVAPRFRGSLLGRSAVRFDQCRARERLSAIWVRCSSVGPCPGQCPAVTLRLIASPIGRNRSIGSNSDGLSGAEGNTAHSSAADPTSWFQLLTIAGA